MSDVESDCCKSNVNTKHMHDCKGHECQFCYFDYICSSCDKSCNLELSDEYARTYPNSIKSAQHTVDDKNTVRDIRREAIERENKKKRNALFAIEKD